MSTITAGTNVNTSLNYSADTTGNLVFQSGSSSNTALTLDSTQNATFTGNVSVKSILSGTYTDVAKGVAKAWVSYNGSGQTIYSSFNCSSVTYNSATNYTFNFTNVMPNANYAVLCTIGGAVAQAGLAPWGTPTASSFVFTMGGSTNPTYVSVAVFSL